MSEESVLSVPKKLESFILSLKIRPELESYLGPGIANRWNESFTEIFKITESGSS